MPSKEILAETLVPISDSLRSHRYRPSLLFKNSDIQMVLPALVPEFFDYFRTPDWHSERSLVGLKDGASIAIDCSMQQNLEIHPTVVIVPGLGSSSESVPSLGLAHKAYFYDFNVVRMNLRTQGQTEPLSRALYHSGQSEDLITLLDYLTSNGMDESGVYIAGISLGGNICLKAMGELGKNAKPQVQALAVLSSVTDPSIRLIEERRNLIYQRHMVKDLKDTIRKMNEFYPETYDVSLLDGISTVRGFDEAYHVPFWRFKSVWDFYAVNRALPVVPKIAVPTLAIHARDDTLVPIGPLERSEFQENPNIITFFTEHGAHGRFIAGRSIYGDLDRHWAQNRIMEFFRYLSFTQ